MTRSVKCSVVIPVFNRIATVGRSIRSVLEFFENRDFEIIIVDDASTDRLQEYLQAEFKSCYEKPWFTFIRLDVNKGVTASKNRGYEQAQGKWVIFLDSDDALVTEASAKFFDLLDQYNSVPLLFFRCVDQNGKFVGKKFGADLILDLKTYLRFTSYGEAITVFNKGKLGSKPPYVEELRGYEGLGCAEVIDEFGPAVLVNQVIRTYHLDGQDRMSSKQGLRRRTSLILRGHVRMLIQFVTKMDWVTRLMFVARILVYGGKKIIRS